MVCIWLDWTGLCMLEPTGGEVWGGRDWSGGHCDATPGPLGPLQGSLANNIPTPQHLPESLSCGISWAAGTCLACGKGKPKDRGVTAPNETLSQ